MTDLAALQRLLTWLSPAFPVGTFAWSQGLETAINDGRIKVGADLKDWIGGTLVHGGLKTDAIILAHAHRAAGDAAMLQELADLALALTASSERHDGDDAHRRSLRDRGAGLAVGRVCAICPIPAPTQSPSARSVRRRASGCQNCSSGYLTTAVHSQVSVAVRLVPLGQTAGLQVMAGLEPAIAALAETAAHGEPRRYRRHRVRQPTSRRCATRQLESESFRS